MGITTRWAGSGDWERVAETRLRCYARAGQQRADYLKWLTNDPRSADADFLLAEETQPAGGAEPIGTVTSLNFTMWIRGSALPCQGIAWVGTVRTHRRQSGGAAGDKGIASRLMHEALNKARERGHVISALMPFRVSFYQHFGYGIVEHRNVWTVPLSILPSGPSAGIRYAAPADLPGMAALSQRAAQAGQCDIERSPQRLEDALKAAMDNGFVLVDPTDEGHGLRGFLSLETRSSDGKDNLEITDTLGYAFEDWQSLKRQLHFLATQRDQFSSVILRLPADVPLNYLLREKQVAHRPVNHPVSTCSPQTRMQLRVLDHPRLLENLRLPAHPTGKAAVCIKESEGHESQFSLDFHDGRIAVFRGGGGPCFTCEDHTWASIVCGNLSATTACRLGLAESEHASVTTVLDQLASPPAGPMPFSHEYF